MKLFKTEKQVYIGGWIHWVLTIIISSLAMTAAVTLFKDYTQIIMFSVSLMNIIAAAIARQLPNGDQKKEEGVGK
jgi:hypothetical protein